ncbi:hypothetical protein [Nocardioides sp. AE5]|uniref:hypothetical protein n=1 Tax=Nocardioides sp. AE5 TaxID=2962573 RepID=UPI0028819818|nr:hypothetical protein [Nocardioides sp. AE5]MDT0202961.1 hypothetical protein [Nocardioides sp. AE5]
MASEEEQIRDVERSLDAGATRHHLRARRAWGLVGTHTNRDDRVQAELALWLCACYNDGPSPTWLIFGNDDDLAWCSMPAGMDVDDVVHADVIAGSHTSSGEVLDFLAGTTLLPGDYYGESTVARRIAKRLLASP